MNGTPLVSPRRQGDWLKYEEDRYYSRDNIVVASGQGKLAHGMVLAKITLGAAVAAAVSNTGDGAMGAITVGAGALPGVYRLTIIEPATNAGAFVVENPNGVNIGHGTVGVAFAGGGLSFTLADGATDFVAGDQFTITVAEGSGKFVAYDPAGTNGSAVAAGILCEDVDATSADAKGAAIVRHAHIAPSGLAWGANADLTAERDAALATLAKQGILTVREV